MDFSKVFGVVLLAAAIGGCKNGTVQPDAPALIVEPSAASRLELQRVVSEALHGAEVKLAEDALADSSVLIIERRAHQDAQGRRIMGRDLERPERFQLLISGGDCVLMQEGSDERFTLQEADCVPANP